jgi:hypothetical protein
MASSPCRQANQPKMRKPIRNLDQTTTTGDTSPTAILVAINEPPQTAMAASSFICAINILDDLNTKSLSKKIIKDATNQNEKNFEQIHQLTFRKRT